MMESLSDEILLKIFSHLKHRDSVSLQLSCRRFSQLFSDPSLHSSFDVNGTFHYSSQMLQRHVNKHKNLLQSLTITNCYWITPTQLHHTLQCCTKLKTLNVIGAPLSCQGLAMVFENSLQLKELHWTVQSALAPNDLRQEDDFGRSLLMRLRIGFITIKRLALQFSSMQSFETFLPVLRPPVSVYHLSLEYIGDHVPCSTTFLSSMASGYNFVVSSNAPFAVYEENGIRNNAYIHFNLLLMGFVMRVVYCAAEKNELTALLAAGTINSLCWQYINGVYGAKTLTRLDLTSAQLSKEQIDWLNSLKNLVYLCLRGVTQLKGNLLKAIAVNCSNLTSLNLSDSDGWIDQDLCAIEAISTKCTKLTDLNLTGIHLHTNKTGANRLCTLLARMSSLKAIALPACSLANIDVRTVGSSSNNDRVGLSNRRQLNIPAVAHETNHSMTSAHCQTRNQSHQKLHELEVSNIGNGIKDLQLLSDSICELEIIDKDFTSPFSHFKSTGSLVCQVTRLLFDDVFDSLVNWSVLKRLTLAGLPSLGSFHSLTKIAETCTQLEYINLAYIGLPGNSAALLSLPKAISQCSNLRTFRLDQPNYNLSDQLLSAFQSCKKLEAICVIHKNGKIPKSQLQFIDLFENCPRLFVIQTFSGDVKAKCHRFQTDLIKKYRKKRPPLSITIATYSQALTQQGLSAIPYVHLRDLTHFRSRIAIGI